MSYPDFESAIARMHDALSELAVAFSDLSASLTERFPFMSIHHNSHNEFVRALDWAERHRPDLVAIFWRTKKWRTRKKYAGRIIKEWRKHYDQRT